MTHNQKKPEKTLREQAEARLKSPTPEIDNLGPEEIRTLIHDYQVHQIELEIQNEELRNTQEQLSLAHDRFASLYNNAPAGYISIDHSAIIKQTNQTFAAMVGKDPGQLIGRPLIDFLDPHDRPVFHGRYKAFFKNPQGKRLELNLSGKHGKLVVRCVGRRENVSGVRTGHRHQENLLLVVNDVTKRKLAEQALLESEERYRLLSDVTMEGIVIHSNGLVRDVNSSLTKLLGYSKSELLGKNIIDVAVHKDDVDLVKKNVVKEYAEPYSVRCVRKNGEIFHAELEARNFETLGQSLRVAAVRDITQRIAAEEALVQSHERLKTVMDSLDALVYIIDMRTYEILFINEYGRRTWGNVVGRKCWEALQNEMQGPCPFCTNHKLISPDNAPAGTHRWEFLNTSNARWYDCRDQAIYWTDGRLVRMEIATDITGRKKTEEKIKRMNQELQKSSDEKDKLFSIIAHDLKSPLSGVLSLSEMLADESETLSREDLGYALQEMNKSTRNLFILLNDLLQWARMSQGSIDYSPSVCSLKDLLDSSLETAHEVARQKNISLTSTIPQHLMVTADRDMISTVIRNITFNALKFTHPGGQVSVTVRQDQTLARIIIQDNGIGMNKHVLSRIFDHDPVKRQLGTRGEKGTGLGLILCREFIEKHGGEINIQSTPGKGTTVGFTLMLSQ